MENAVSSSQKKTMFEILKLRIYIFLKNIILKIWFDLKQYLLNTYDSVSFIVALQVSINIKYRLLKIYCVTEFLGVSESYYSQLKNTKMRMTRSNIESKPHLYELKLLFF